MNHFSVKHPTKSYTLTTDPSAFDMDAVYDYIGKEAYWSKGIPRDAMERSFRHSISFALIDGDGTQVGAARAITDTATFMYLADVYVLKEHRGGLGTWMVGEVLKHSDLQGLRRMMLATSGSESLYRKFGFQCVTEPNILMQKKQPGVYRGEDT